MKIYYSDLVFLVFSQNVDDLEDIIKESIFSVMKHRTVAIADTITKYPLQQELNFEIIDNINSFIK